MDGVVNLLEEEILVCQSSSVGGTYDSGLLADLLVDTTDDNLDDLDDVDKDTGDDILLTLGAVH